MPLREIVRNFCGGRQIKQEESIHLKFFFIYFWLLWVFLAVYKLSLSSWSDRGFSLVEVCGLLTAVAPLVVVRGF